MRTKYSPRWLSAAASFGLAVLAGSVICLGAGPDIIHSNLQDAAHYGPVGTTHAYAWGTTTCNLGGSSLSWINGGTPALAMNAYRLYNGRLIQIGIGQCKTGCCVANSTGCGVACQPATPPNNFGLRPGCMDVYGAGFNGGQSHLGPRSGINPYEGTFTTIPAGSGDAIWRRCQVTQANMSASLTGALYFAEGVYVCMEEDPSDELNNATYRRMTVANTGAAPTYVWNVTDASRPTFPAIYAWRDYGNGVNQPDNSVFISNADVPGEGRFIGAGKVRDLGNGTWLYDYAVFNLNSHRAGASLRVAVDPAASITDVGFSAPTYHSDDTYSNTPWTYARQQSGAAQWSSPQTFEQNQNTNALRWATMYNFWFTSSAPPAPSRGSLALGLFRPGTPTSINITNLPVPCVPPQLTSTPTDHNACACETVVLTSPAAPNASAGALTYQWQHETSPGNFTNVVDASGGACPGASISGASTATLTITGLAYTDAGLYRCIVSNGCGTTTSPAALVNVCVGDFNCDGGTDGSDIDSYFSAWENGQSNADVNLDGGVDGADVQFFYERWSGGC